STSRAWPCHEAATSHARASSVTGLEESIPFCVIHSPGTCFCPGSAQGRRLMGFMRGTGRPICGKRDRIVGCVDNSHDGLAWSIVPAKGLRFGESLVWGPARNPVCRSEEHTSELQSL